MRRRRVLSHKQRACDEAIVLDSLGDIYVSVLCPHLSYRQPNHDLRWRMTGYGLDQVFTFHREHIDIHT